MVNTDPNCRMCGDAFEAGDTIVRLMVRQVIEDPAEDPNWGHPFDGGLRPVEEHPGRQYAHIGCLDATGPEESKRTNARIIDPEETEPDADG